MGTRIDLYRRGVGHFLQSSPARASFKTDSNTKDLETVFGQDLDHSRHLVFTGGTNHGHRRAEASVSGIGHMGVNGEGIGENIVATDNAGQMTTDQTLSVTNLADAAIGFIQAVQTVVNHRLRQGLIRGRPQHHLNLQANGLEKTLMAPRRKDQIVKGIFLISLSVMPVAFINGSRIRFKSTVRVN